MSFGEITFTKSTTLKSSSQTVTDKIAHPVAHFLGSLGIDISEYPKVSVLLETKEHIFKNTQTYLVMRVPGEQGLLYESVARIKRIIEIPSADLGDHRKFVEVEWFIDETGLLEEENHPAFAFLSSEVECPKCKTFFVPDAGLKNDQSLEIGCPSCLMKWEIKVDSDFINDPQPRLLSEYCAKEPEESVKLVKKWQQPSSNTEDDRQTFFFSEFSTGQESSSLDWFFGEQRVYTQHTSRCDGDFELLWRSFFNYLYETHLKGAVGGAANLLHTEVFRKSELLRKNEETVTPSVFKTGAEAPSQVTEPIPIKKNISSAFEAEFGPFVSQTDVRSLEEVEAQQEAEHPPLFSKQTQLHRPMTPHRQDRSWVLFASLAASLMLFASLATFFYMQSRSTDSSLNNQSMAAIQPHQITSDARITNSETVVESLAVESKKKVLGTTAKNETTETDSAALAEKAQNADSSASTTELSATKEASPVEELQSADEPSAKEIKEEALAKLNAEQERQAQQAILEAEQAKQREQEIARANRLAAERAAKERQERLNKVYDDGMALFNRESYEQAIGKFKEVIQLDPRHAEGYRNLGLAFVYSEQYDEGRATLETYLSLAGPNADTEIQSHVRQVLSFIDSWSAQ